MVAAMATVTITGVYGFLLLARRDSGTRPSKAARSVVEIGADTIPPQECIIGCDRLSRSGLRREARALSSARGRSPGEYPRHWGPLIVWLGASGVMSGSLVWVPGVACLGAIWGS